MNSDYDNPWGNFKNQSWSHQIRGKKADVVVLDEYTENLSGALDYIMAEQYKKTALDELFGVK